MSVFSWIAAAILTLVWLYGVYLQILRGKSASRPVPANVSDVYDVKTNETRRAYAREKSRVALFALTLSYVVETVLMLTASYAAFARLFPPSLFMQMEGVVLASALSGILSIPVEYYDTMVVEQKYGFNRSTKRTFFLDQLKNFLIGLIVMTAVGSLLMWLHLALGDWLILAFAIAMTILALFIVLLYPVLSRAFNKFTPLEDGELKQKLTLLLEKHSYRVRAVQVMDASRRTTKVNAYFAGFGRMKTIVLYDTLMKTLTTEEICAVFAHELGHGLHKDTLKNQILSFVQMLILSVLAFFTLKSQALYAGFGFDGINYGFSMIWIMSVEFALISPLISLAVNAHSRRAEYRADRQAVEEGYAASLISALKKLARENYSDLAPDPLLVKLTYSHPTLSQRIGAIEKEVNRDA